MNCDYVSENKNMSKCEKKLIWVRKEIWRHKKIIGGDVKYELMIKKDE